MFFSVVDPNALKLDPNPEVGTNLDLDACPRDKEITEGDFHIYIYLVCTPALVGMVSL